MAASVGRDAWKLLFEISPIALSGGLMSFVPGQIVPIVVLTEAVNFVGNLLTGSMTLDALDEFFAHWEPVPGSTMTKWEIGTYSFANQAVAANAVVKQPLQLSMVMKCPVKTTAGYYEKLATMEAIQLAIDMHVNQGGSFIIATPSLIYLDCLLAQITDVSSSGDGGQPQVMWKWDFVKPLVTQSAADSLHNIMMSKLKQFLPTDGAWSGADVATGGSLTGISPSSFPSATSSLAAGVNTSALPLGITSSGVVT